MFTIELSLARFFRAFGISGRLNTPTSPPRYATAPATSLTAKQLLQCVRTLRVEHKEIYWMYWRKTSADIQSLFQKTRTGQSNRRKISGETFRKFRKKFFKIWSFPLQEAAAQFKHPSALKLRTINAVSNSEEKEPIVRCYSQQNTFIFSRQMMRDYRRKRLSGLRSVLSWNWTLVSATHLNFYLVSVKSFKLYGFSGRLYSTLAVSHSCKVGCSLLLRRLMLFSVKINNEMNPSPAVS